jgi:HEAT repeat protein
LKETLGNAPTAVKPSVAEGIIRAAEGFMHDGNSAKAIELYDVVRNATLPEYIVLEGVRGAILARKADGIPLLVEQLRSQDKARFAIGLRAARELPGSQATQAVVAEMHRATPERQPLLLLALADRADDSALPTIYEAAKSGPPQLRLVAVRVLDRLSRMSSVPVLVEVAAGSSGELNQAAMVALTRMPGNELETKLLQDLGKASGNTRRVLIELAARRQVEAAAPMIVKYAEDPDPATRRAAVQALGSIGGPGQVNDLVTLISAAKDPKQHQDVEEALLAISGRLGKDCTPALLPLLRSGDASVRKVALHALAAAGGPEALAAVGGAVQDRDEGVQDEAVRTLATWPNTWPEDEAIAQPLLELAKSSKKSNYQVLALRGYFQYLQGDKKLQNEEKVTRVKKALPLTSRPEEKQLAIAVVQSVPSASALDILVNLSGEPAVLEEACSAIVDSAGKEMPGVSAADRRKALQTAFDKTKNEGTKKKASAALAKMG